MRWLAGLGVGGVITTIVGGLLLVIGWFMNIFAIIGMATADAPVNAMFILRIVGIFVAPLGGILGRF